MAIEYNFKYMPLVGKLSGESMVQQTETAINEIAKIVNDNTAQAEIINTLAEQANANSVEALEKATEALDTSSRVYLKETLAVDLDNYCESQLIYINNTASQNLPVAHTGFLEVKTNDDKTQATQVFADDVDRKFYVRTGEITATTVGDVTTYTASYGDWVDIPNITDLDNYLALAGGTMSGDIEFSASEWKIKGSDIDNDAELSIVGATDNLNGSSLNLYGRNHAEGGAFELNANNGTYTKTLKGDASGNLKWNGNSVALAKDFLPLSGGTMTGTLVSTQAISFRQNGENASLQLYGGTDSTSSRLILFGKANSVYPGAFSLEARDDSNAMSLYGAPSGTLTWGGNDIITAAGGTMTGTLTLKSPAVIANQTVTSRRNVTDSWNLLLGGTSDSNGAYLRLDGSTSSMTGSFTLKANDGTNSKTLVGSPNGTLTWGGTSVSLSGHTHPYLPLSGGTMTGEIIRNTYVVKNNVDNSYTEYLGGKDETSSYLVLCGKSNSASPGRINLRANDGTHNSYLTLDPNGSATWYGHQLERVNASGTYYVRFDSGLQICWGTTANKTTNAGANVSIAITFPVAFKDTNYTITFVDRFNANNWQNHTMSTNSYSTTGVNLYLQNNANGAYTFGFSWMAIGKWK